MTAIQSPTGGSSLSTPVTVVNGGTGISSATANALITGGVTSTSPFQAVAASVYAPAWVPGDSGFLTANRAPEADNSSTPSNGVVFLFMLPVRYPMTISSLCVGVSTAAAAGVSTGTFSGLYSVTAGVATLLTGSADTGALWQSPDSSNMVTTALTTPQVFTVVPSSGFVYGALLFNLTARPALFAPSQASNNVGCTLGTGRAVFYSTGSPTSLPASITLSGGGFIGFSGEYFVGAR